MRQVERTAQEVHVRAFTRINSQKSNEDAAEFLRREKANERKWERETEAETETERGREMDRGREIVLKERHEGKDSGEALSCLEMEERLFSPRVIAEMKGQIYLQVNI